MIEIATKLQNVLYKNSDRVDELNTFPSENLALLKDAGLMNFLVPKNLGGYGGDLGEMTKIAKILGSACLSTGMIWAMHCQQIACLANHGKGVIIDDLLTEICKKNHYLGSITSEVGNSGHLLNVSSPLIYQSDRILLNRYAPIVTGGTYCDAFLITMKSNEEALTNDIKLVYALKNQLTIKSSTGWKSLGMRGTNSVGLSLEGEINSDQIINPDTDFADIAYETMIPVGHIAWTSCWLGATIGVFKEVTAILNKSVKTNKTGGLSELTLEKIARVRLAIDAVQCMINEMLINYQSYYSNNKQKLRSPSFYIKVNNLKVFASEQLFGAVNNLMDIAGMRYAYLKNELCHLERVFRDLRAASMMINNNNLLVANGKLALFEKAI